MKNTCYLRAATLVDARPDELSCLAIDEALGRRWMYPASKESIQYGALFCPDDSMRFDLWGNEWGDAKKECRVLALLFMHWISQS